MTTGQGSPGLPLVDAYLIAESPADRWTGPSAPTEGLSQPSVGVSLPYPRTSGVKDALEPWEFFSRGLGFRALLGQEQMLFSGMGVPVLTLCSAVETTFAMVTHIPVASRTAHS